MRNGADLQCACGHHQSRVNRAWNRLAELLEIDSEAEIELDLVSKAAIAAEELAFR